MTPQRPHITIRRDTPTTYMLTVTYGKAVVAAQRATKAECQVLAKRILAALELGGDLLKQIHAMERAG